MGQAKQRGTQAERIEQSIARKQAQVEHEVQQMVDEAKNKRADKNSAFMAKHATALLMAIAAGVRVK